jgi:hypothetical protein
MVVTVPIVIIVAVIPIATVVTIVAILFFLKMKAIFSFETLAYLHRTKQHYILEGRIFKKAVERNSE